MCRTDKWQLMIRINERNCQMVIGNNEKDSYTAIGINEQNWQRMIYDWDQWTELSKDDFWLGSMNGTVKGWFMIGINERDWQRLRSVNRTEKWWFHFSQLTETTWSVKCACPEITISRTLPVTILHPQFFSCLFLLLFSPFFLRIYIYIYIFFFFSPLPRPSAGKRKWKLYYSASLDTFILFTFLVGVISRAERVKIGFGRVCENTDTSGMADEVETSIAEILHGPWEYTGRPRED